MVKKGKIFRMSGNRRLYKGAGYSAMLVASVPPSNASTPVTLSLLGAIQIGSTRPKILINYIRQILPD